MNNDFAESKYQAKIVKTVFLLRVTVVTLWHWCLRVTIFDDVEWAE